MQRRGYKVATHEVQVLFQQNSTWSRTIWLALIKGQYLESKYSVAIPNNRSPKTKTFFMYLDYVFMEWRP